MHRQRRKQRPLLEQHAETPAHHAPHLRIGIKHLVPEDLDASPLRRQQADNLAQQRRFPAAGAANQPEHFAGLDDKVNIAMNDRLTVARPHSAHLDDRRCGRSTHSGIPTLRVRMAKTASTTMTMVMDVTTEAVVFDDRLSVFGLTLRPK